MLELLHQVDGTQSLIVPAPDLGPRVAELEADLAAQDADRCVRQANDEATMARDALRDFRQKVVDVALEQGRKRGWCSELQDILVEELDLGDLVRRTVTVSITFEVDIEDVDLEDGPEQDQVDRAAVDFIRNNLSYEHWTQV